MSSKRFSKDFACNHRKYLPCRFGYLDGDRYRCSYHRLIVWIGGINRDKQTTESLVREACPPIQAEEEFTWFARKLHQEFAKEIIEKSKVGDLIFCFNEIDGEVVLLERPSTIFDHCVYKDKKGEVKSYSVSHFRLLSKGNYNVEHHIEGEKSEIQSQMIKRMAGETGFRVEILETERGHLLRIFGDSQQELDDFMTVCVYNKFIIK
ncbi:MAG: hypothetical protein ACFFEN_05750 [Candidatus Thorarchaeota archaeon]